MKIHLSNYKCRQGGYTLVESLIVVALSAVITMAAMYLRNATNKNIDQFGDLFEDASDTILSERFILYDLRAAFPSFNNVEVNDDDGRPFFDLINDVPGSTVANPTRTITLGPSIVPADKQTQEVIFLITKSFAAIYDPIVAYDDDPVLKTVTFNSLNKGNYINGATGLFPGLWLSGSLWMLYSPVGLRPVGALLSVAAKWPIFVGKVNGVNLLPEPLSTATVRTPNGRIVRTSHPVETMLTVDSADTFFQKLYPSSGGPPPVFLMPVSFVKYTFEKKETKPGSGVYINQLLRRAWKNGAFEASGQLIATDIKKVLFTRDSVTIPSVGAQVVRK
jgi:prepilin-type N-terminal cleavage/methylation domain-containing protein